MSDAITDLAPRERHCRAGIAQQLSEWQAPLAERIVYDIERACKQLAMNKRDGQSFTALSLIELEKARDWLNEVLG